MFACAKLQMRVLVDKAWLNWNFRSLFTFYIHNNIITCADDCELRRIVDRLDACAQCLNYCGYGLLGNIILKYKVQSRKT